MKQVRLSALLLLLASITANFAAAPHNDTASLVSRMNHPYQYDDDDCLSRMAELADIGSRWIDAMMTPIHPNAVDNRELSRSSAQRVGWSRNDRTGQALPVFMQDIHGLDDVQGIPRGNRPAPAISMRRLGWTWTELEQNQPYFYPHTQSQEPPTTWSFHGLYNAEQRATVIPKAYGKEINTTPNPLPATVPLATQRPPQIHAWTQLTWIEYTAGRPRELRKPIRTVYFPAVEGNSEDLYFFNYSADYFRGNGPLPQKPGVTFPIGSYGHKLLLGTDLGKQVSKLTYENKIHTDAAVIVAVHIWDSGAPGGYTPNIVFSIERYNNRIAQARQTNIEAGGEYPMVRNWPHKFLPNFV